MPWTGAEAQTLLLIFFKIWTGDLPLTNPHSWPLQQLQIVRAKFREKKFCYLIKTCPVLRALNCSSFSNIYLLLFKSLKLRWFLNRVWVWNGGTYRINLKIKFRPHQRGPFTAFKISFENWRKKGKFLVAFLTTLKRLRCTD